MNTKKMVQQWYSLKHRKTSRYLKCTMYHHIMELKNFLISIGRLKADEEIQKSDPKKVDNLDTIREPQTVGEIFDLLKERYKQMPERFSINVPGWPDNRFN